MKKPRQLKKPAKKTEVSEESFIAALSQNSEAVKLCPILVEKKEIFSGDIEKKCSGCRYNLSNAPQFFNCALIAAASKEPLTLEEIANYIDSDAIEVRGIFESGIAKFSTKIKENSDLQEEIDLEWGIKRGL